MKRALIAFLVSGIFCSGLLSQEISLNFDNPAQFALAETVPDGLALGHLAGPGIFSLKSSLRGSPDRVSVFCSADLPRVGDTLRTAVLSNPTPSDGNNSAQDRIKKNRLVSGLLLAGSWVATIVVDLFYQDNYRATTLIPIVGPWLTLGKIHGQGWGGVDALLILSGVAQAGFATWFIVSLSQHSKPSDTKSVTISAGLNTLNLRIQF